MANLIILTSHFPFASGESFFEPEVTYWDNTKFENVYIQPSSPEGTIRPYPRTLRLINQKKIEGKYRYGFLALFNKLFLREVRYIFKNTSPRNWTFNVIQGLKTTALTIKEKHRLKRALKGLGKGPTLVYCYWNDLSAYGAVLLKREGLVQRVVTRAHGFDLYQERRRNCYMPIKRQLVDEMDRVYLLSKNALEYFVSAYEVPCIEKVAVARLGVSMSEKRNFNGDSSSTRTIKLLSLSYCRPVKQIPVICGGVSLFAEERRDFKVVWTHIGGGDLLSELKAQAKKTEAERENLKIIFTDTLPHGEVLERLEREYFDVIINASEFEGVPVSIMEAMSNGIPAVAPDVGGICELVNNENGYLMPSDCTARDIATGIKVIVENKSAVDFRSNAHNWVKKHYNASINFPEFVAELERLGEF